MMRKPGPEVNETILLDCSSSVETVQDSEIHAHETTQTPDRSRRGVPGGF